MTNKPKHFKSHTMYHCMTNNSAYFNIVSALNKYMKRAEMFSEAGILKGKVRLVSLLFFRSLYWWIKLHQTYISN